MAISTAFDYHRGPRLAPADLLELYREREPDDPLLRRALAAAAGLAPPSADLPWTHRERREAVFAAIHRGETADALQLAAGWLEVAVVEAEMATDSAEPAALSLVAALEAWSAQREYSGGYSAAALALAAALRLHQRRASLPFHGVLLRRAASALAALGGVEASRLVAAEALRLAIEADDSLAAAYSLGAAARMAALAHEWPSVLASVAAARRFLPAGEPWLRFSLFQVEGTALVGSGRLAAAEEALDEAAKALAESPAAMPENYLLWARGRLRQAQDRHAEAAELLALAVESGRSAQEPLNRVLLALHLAESLGKLGRNFELERLKQNLKEERSLAGIEGAAVVAAAVEGLVA